MSEIGHLQITFTGGVEMRRSMETLIAFANSLESGGERILRALVILCETRSGIVVDFGDLTASGAGEFQPMRVLPDQRYLKLVSTVASDFDCDITFVSHWPILRASSSLRTMAERGGESISAPGGAQ